jgi:hypothetical protein
VQEVCKGLRKSTPTSPGVESLVRFYSTNLATHHQNFITNPPSFPIHQTVFALRFLGYNFLSLFCRWRRVGPFADIGGAILDATIVVVTIAVVSQQVTQLSVSTMNICDTPGIAHGHDFDTGREEICRDR